MRVPRQWLLVVLLGAALTTGGGAFGLHRLDRAFPPPLPGPDQVSTVVLDREGRLLRAFSTPDGRWRLPVDQTSVDPLFLKMLIACEDRRFWSHGGVDALALFRAAWQALWSGRIISGGSTLTMQVARLIEPRTERSLSSKMRQMLRALQIERRLSKRDILDLYLVLAPYGGNLEGVRSASLAYFRKEPQTLTLSEAALLVALPQRPEARRPDRNPENALQARGRVLARVAEEGIIQRPEAERARTRPIPTRYPMPALAAHLGAEAIRRHPQVRKHATTLDRDIQIRLERVAREAAHELGPGISVALLLADGTTGEILARVGSAHAFDETRLGAVDMVQAVRSPGSTLKPMIYALALDQGLIHPETLMEDRPNSFQGYRPGNLDMAHQGDVTVRTALQLSLNIPAIQLLEAVDPARLVSSLRAGGVELTLPGGQKPGLPIGLGGAGMTLKGLVQAYTPFVNGGLAAELGDGIITQPKGPSRQILSHGAAWQVMDILAGVAPPPGVASIGIAYKTGTSFGYRDAWSIGFDGQHLLGVWAGRVDGTPVPGFTGLTTAAPILFEAFAASGLGRVHLPARPPSVRALKPIDLPLGLRRFTPPSQTVRIQALAEPPPAIVFPPNGARLDLGTDPEATLNPLFLKVQAGRAPFRILANGRPLPHVTYERTPSWIPDSRGFSTLTVIDAAGRSASVRVFLE